MAAAITLCNRAIARQIPSGRASDPLPRRLTAVAGRRRSQSSTDSGTSRGARGPGLPNLALVSHRDAVRWLARERAFEWDPERLHRQSVAAGHGEPKESRIFLVEA